MIVRFTPNAVEQLLGFPPELRRTFVFRVNSFAFGEWLPAGPTEWPGVYYAEVASVPVRRVALFRFDLEADLFWVLGFAVR